MALLFMGIVLLLPPVAGLSLIDEKIGGLPFPLLYVFVVWALLIVGAALLARPLASVQPGERPATPDEPPV